MAINPSKLLPAAKKSSSAIVKADKFLAPKKFDSESSGIIKSTTTSSNKVFYSIKEKVIDVDKLLGALVLQNKEENAIVKKQLEDDKREKKEEKLEKPKGDKQKAGLKLPSLPGRGLFATIGDFILKTLTGFILYRLIDYGPQILRFLKIAAPAFDFVIDIGGKLLNGLVTFIDWGYKAVDATKGFIKNIAGEDGAKNFDKLASGLTTFMNYAVIAGMLAADSAMSDEGFGRGGIRRRGFDRSGRRVGRNLQKRYFERYGKEQFLRRFGKENLKNVGKNAARGALTKLGRNALVGTLGKGGTKALLRLATPLLRNIPIIGGLTEFALSWALGDPVGKAAFRGIGSLLVGAVGTAIGGPIGAAIGGFIGGEVGGKLYEMFFKNKKPTPKDKAPRKVGGGAVTRAGKLTGGPAKRTVKKTKVRRRVSVTPQKIKPGKDVGGEKKLETIYTDSQIDYLKDQNQKMGKIPFFGPLFSLAIKTLSGDRPNEIDYKNIGISLNNWIGSSFSSSAGFAGGGEVDMKKIFSGEDMSDIIAKSVKDSVSSEVDSAINDLMKEIMLGKPNKKDKGQVTEPEQEPTGSPTLTGNSNAEKVFRYLVDKEGFTPEAAAGIIGNLMQESGVNPKSRQLRGGPGRGIMQWTESERWASLSAWAKSSGKDPWALETQVEWMVKEMKSYGTYNRIKSVTSYKKAVEIFEREMERAGIPNYPRRYQFAADALASFSGGAGGAGGTFVGGGTGAGYGTGGVKIAGDLGDFMKANRSKIGVTGDIHQHPRHPEQERRNYFSYHNQNRALDIGGWGPAHPSSGGRDEQAPVIRALLEWNKKNGYKPIEIIHGSPAFKGLGKYESAPNALHSNHVHVAYSRGGKTKGISHFAMLGEEGPEFVIDADSTSAIEATFPGFLDAINKAKYEDAVNVLRNYASYETETVYIEVPVEVPVPMESDYGETGGILPIAIGVNNNNDLFDILNCYG